MPSFVADCPRGHKGNFVTYWGYHHCSCGLQISVFNVPSDEPTTLGEMEARIKDEVDKQVATKIEDAIDLATRKLEEEYEHSQIDMEARLAVIDPEYRP